MKHKYVFLFSITMILQKDAAEKKLFANVKKKDFSQKSNKIFPRKVYFKECKQNIFINWIERKIKVALNFINVKLTTVFD